MKQKDQYTLYELFDNLPIPLTELSKISGKSHGTLTRIRDGYPARKDTINKLLIVFSDLYKLDLSSENVRGITIEERQHISRKPKKPLVFTPVQSAKVETDKPSKRVYNRKQDTSLPDGCILASKFAETHRVKRPTFIEHMTKGIGPNKDRVDYSERDKPNRNEKEKYLTREQQGKALDFWEKHKVKFALCEDVGCICHELFEIK